MTDNDIAYQAERERLLRGEPENLFLRILDAFDEGLEVSRSSALRFALTFSLLGFIFGLYLLAAHLGINTIVGDEPSYHSGGKILRFVLVLLGISAFSFFVPLVLYVSLRPWALRTDLERLHILRRGFGIQLERRGQEVECTAEVEANAADGVVEQSEALLRRFWTTRHLRRDRDFLEAIVRPKGVFTPARSPWVELKVHRDGRKVRFVARHYTRNRPEQEPFDVGASLVLLGALISLTEGKPLRLSHQKVGLIVSEEAKRRLSAVTGVDRGVDRDLQRAGAHDR